MYWTGGDGGKQDAQEIDDLAAMQKWIAENPGQAQAYAAGMGGLDLLSMGSIEGKMKELAAVRSSYPWTWRAGQAGIPVGLSLAARQVATPLLPNAAVAVARDPSVQRFYHDRIEKYMNSPSPEAPGVGDQIAARNLLAGP